jgi:transcriptional regulator with XRE-family HTH domain
MNNPSSKHLGKNISHIRLLKGIKQSVFARELGVSQQAVSKMENTPFISHSKLLHVSLILGVSTDTIINFQDKLQL